MHLEEIILDGFKSYATHTPIGLFSSTFTAITGLNGSGKSNILDSICFVMGIDLDRVRAGSVGDLIYKKGSAGVVKASVTLMFRCGSTTSGNTAKSTSKSGDKDIWSGNGVVSVTRQIIIGGKSKYFINGRTVQAGEIATLFQSIKLNIHNPNFLIQQGKITQILNMNGLQTLAMIEEAAGTKVYEERKEKAVRTMEKKEGKLASTTFLLDTEVTPKLETLKSKKETYMRFVKVEGEMQEGEKRVVMSQCVELQTREKKAEEKVCEATGSERHLKGLMVSLSEECLHLEKELSALTIPTMSKEAEAEVKEANKSVNQITSQLEGKKSLISEENGRLRKLSSKIEVEQLKVESSLNELVLLEKKSKVSLLEYSGLEEKAVSIETLLETLTTGLGSKEGTENGFLNQLSHANVACATLASARSKLLLSLDYSQRALSEDQSEYEKEKKALSKLNLIRLVKPTEEVDYSSHIHRLEKVIRETVLKRDGMSRGLPTFTYTKPTPTFDASRVKGVVASLLEVSRGEHSLALEVCGGGRLYQVVVDTQDTATSLLLKGKLVKRSTLLPLNKIAVRLDTSRIERGIAKGGLLASSLVSFDKENQNAIDYVFGSSIVCPSAEVAAKVTFEVGLRSVTLEGDVYESNGILTGGSQLKTSNLLQRFKDVKMLDLELRHLHVEAEEWQKKAEKYNGEMEKFEDLSLDLHLKMKRVKLDLIEKFDGLHEQFNRSKGELEEIEIKLRQREKDVLRLEREVEELKTDRTGKLASLSDDLRNTKSLMLKLDPDISQIKRQIATKRDKLDLLQGSLKQTKESVALLENTISIELQHQKQLEEDSKHRKRNLESATEKFQQEKQLALKSDKELLKLENSLNVKAGQREEVKLEHLKVSMDLSLAAKQLQDTSQTLKSLSLKHKWLQNTTLEKCDDLDALSKALAALKKDHLLLSREVDESAADMYDKVSLSEQSLKSKLNLLSKSKSQISTTITYLGLKKLDQLNSTFTKVNQDFGEIFALLLPGNTCKLSYTDDSDITQGLEIKVCLGGLWKSSLTELSGGQRSLIALALTLSLLQFSPAPLYILDEIDAALDLSHTQNIGKLLKERFGGAQFIVVSLKEGMFNNADVLFRTRFENGVSKVSRFAQKK